jgi:serine acetyltransferase
MERELNLLRPPLGRALRIDARQFAANQGDRIAASRWGQWLTVARLLWGSDDYLGVALYRVRCSMLRARVPILPAIINRICIAFYSMNIDDHIVIREGLYLPHGNVVLGGLTLIGRNVTICPWVSIGTRAGSFAGPVLGNRVFVGTHSSILGTMSIGDDATVGAGSVVTGDIPACTTVMGVPAKPVADPEARQRATGA